MWQEDFRRNYWRKVAGPAIRAIEENIQRMQECFERARSVQNELPVNAGMRLSAAQTGSVLDSENPPEAAP
jgi:hypothetical protein